MSKPQLSGELRREVIESARDLYLTVDAKGHKKWNSIEIAKKLSKKFRQPINRSNVYRWIKRYGWEREFQQMIQHGISKVSDADKTLIDKKAEDIKNLYEVARGLNIESSSQLYEKLKKRQIDIKDLIVLLKHSYEVLVNLNDGAKEKGGNVNLYIDEEDLEL